MSIESPKTIFLKDYQAPDFYITHTFLEFTLDEARTHVRTTLKIKKNENFNGKSLVMVGEDLEFSALFVDGKKLDDTQFNVTKERLEVLDLPSECELIVENYIAPATNKALEGLYQSGSIFCTQNEPEGFRRITYFLDRPDVMSIFTTKIIANKEKYPILLSNGNPVESEELEDGFHSMTWLDPFPKPAYLYALVAGDLGLVKDTYITKSGRNVALEIYVDKGNESKCSHAMESLKKSMKWDEDRFNLEYDLDIYMIVAVDSFNMGAMENKGLNIFNSSCVLADEKTATDDNFTHVEAVIGHEYFHNWTGNRVTCRDWFQLTLKEGLTVFRDQEFSSDLNSRIVHRINNVKCLRLMQFSEDAGPTSHPIKPSSFIEINNFYTMTIYEKGSEVIRMIHSLLGEEGFMNGMKKYFELFDGKAVTTEDFLHAMSTANDNFDFSLFINWYNTNGTPSVSFSGQHDKEKETYTMKLTQKGNSTFLIPLAIGLIDQNGNDLALKLKAGTKHQNQLEKGLLLLTQESEEFVFENIKEEPIASINRNFSAPINLSMNYSDQDLTFLMSHENDEFNRYEASQILAQNIIFDLIKKVNNKEELILDENYIKAYGKLLDDSSLSYAFKDLILEIPSLGSLHLKQSTIDYEATHMAREFVLKTLAKTFYTQLTKLYTQVSDARKFDISAESMGQRALKGRVLCLLARIKSEETQKLCYQQFVNASNMTDEILALSNIINFCENYKEKAVQTFYTKWKHETLVMQKWLSVQATCLSDSTFDRIKELQKSDVYDETVPNLLRHLVGVFSKNPLQFNHKSGRGYELVASQIIHVDTFNPQIAARIASSFNDFKKLPKELKSLMHTELKRIVETKGLSGNVYEIISKTLKDA